jgi:ribosomal protein S12 methylthiotransferase accessory factor YcaO
MSERASLNIRALTPRDRAILAVQALPSDVLYRAAGFGGNLEAEEAIVDAVLEAAQEKVGS